MIINEKSDDHDIYLIEDNLIPIMNSFIEDKEKFKDFNTVAVESWLTSLLKVSLLGNTQYFNVGKYVISILDDIDKCKFFISKKSRKDIISFLSTLII